MAASEPKSIFTCGRQSGLSFHGRVEGAFKPPPAERRASAGKPAGQLKKPAQPFTESWILDQFKSQRRQKARKHGLQKTTPWLER
jgi:hypothetical protein